MKKLLSLCVPLLFLAFAHSAYGQQTNVCGTTTVTPGGTFTWGSTYAVPIRVEPAPGTTWFLGQTYVEIPPHGQVTVNVPSDLAPGSWNLQTTFDVQGGGNPCGNLPGTPRIQNPG